MGGMSATDRRSPRRRHPPWLAVWLSAAGACVALAAPDEDLGVALGAAEQHFARPGAQRIGPDAVASISDECPALEIEVATLRSNVLFQKQAKVHTMHSNTAQERPRQPKEAPLQLSRATPPVRNQSAVFTESGMVSKEVLEEMPIPEIVYKGFENLVSAVIVNGVAVILNFLVFEWLSRRYVVMYASNTLDGKAPPVEDRFLGWAFASLCIAREQVIQTAGLDCAMLLECQQLCLKILVITGLPMAFVLTPLHYFVGGAGRTDWLTQVDMANVKDGSAMFWIYPVVVWTVVAVCERLIFYAQRDFVNLRSEWLRALPPPRSRTAMVQQIPKQYSSDAKLAAYVNGLFKRNVVETAYVVRRLPEAFSTQIAALESNKERLLNARSLWQRSGEDPTKRPKLAADGREVDSIDFLSEKVQTGEKEIATERARILKLCDYTHGEGCDLAHDGFVTFKQHYDLEMALGIHATEHSDEFLLTPAPEPMDVRYGDLQTDDTSRRHRAYSGYALMAILFLSYLPIVVLISTLTSLETFQYALPVLKPVVKQYPMLISVWNGVVVTCLLALFVSFVPTFLMLVVKWCFAPPAETWCQQKLQQWYFHFLVVFVLLLFCIGSSFFTTYLRITGRPTRVFELLASTLPSSWRASHFYLMYFTLQWTTHSSHVCRYWNLVLFFWYSRSVDADRARELAEPEDQDYHGIAARTATCSILFVIALLFSTISPLMSPLAIVDFLLCRAVYGYLMVFAETRKPDSGGLFWHNQLEHIRLGLFLYIALMVGILWQRYQTLGPALLAAASYLYLLGSYTRFCEEFSWSRLPLEEVVRLDAEEVKLESAGSYVQPELRLDS